MFGISNKEKNKLKEEIIQEFRSVLREELKSTNEIIESHNKKFSDFEDRLRGFEDRLRDFEYAMRAGGSEPAQPRHAYRGKALIERPEDRDELGLFF